MEHLGNHAKRISKMGRPAEGVNFKRYSATEHPRVDEHEVAAGDPTLRQRISEKMARFHLGTISSEALSD